MALQVRLSLPEFSNGINFTDPIIMEYAESIDLSKTVSSSNESITFEIPVNDPKIEYVNEFRWWECWDTETNERLNYGPIETFGGESGQTKKVSGPGRSAVLQDYIKSVQTFYYPINQFLDDLRFENISAQPRTSTIINKNTASDYYGLSMRSKDYAIDEQTGYIAIGRDTPERGTIKTDQYWSGVARSDHLTVDLGEQFIISKARVLLPWWGGATINNDRVYDWDYSYSTDNSSYTQAYQTPIPNLHGTFPATMGTALYFGESGFEFDQQTPSVLPITAQYWKLNITNTHAWYGNVFDGSLSDEWDWECGESDVFMGETRPSPTISGGIIDKNELTPSNDCHASAVELAFYRKIIGRDSISNLSYVQIQNDNRQITYYHVPDASEMISAGGGVKFEPGTFFRRVDFTASSTTVKDEYNTVLYEGGSGHLEAPAYTRMLLFSDSSAQVTEVDTWQGKLDAFSYGGNYQFTTIPNDSATLHFRGVSVKWYATIPSGVIAGQVSIELRAKNDAGVWGPWSTQVAVLTLPVGVSAEKVWEITPESGILSDNTIYELKITNLNGGFVGIDAFAGYWSASGTTINEDDSRFNPRLPTEVVQEFDQKFTFGSIYKYAGGGLTKQGIEFTGDRVIVYSRKGPNFGVIKIGLVQFLPTGSTVILIPGGEADGSVVVDLESDHEIPQAVVFDSNDYFTDPADGLPWDHYFLGVYKPTDDNPIWVDGITLHESSGLSVKFLNTNYLEILKATTEALQMEWDITEDGIKVVPRIGTDTDEIYAEGRGTTIHINDTQDVSQIATMLDVTGADIDGLPLSAVVENKNTKAVYGRTIMRSYDLRNVADFFTLIGAARAELMRRRAPQKRLTIERVGEMNNEVGDSFLVKKQGLEGRFRAITITRNQSSSSGTRYTLECLEWPPII
jgi:hypothetical protein